MRLIVLPCVFALVTSCIATTPKSPLEEGHWVTTYYDRNHDGIVDFELHLLPGTSDTAWALSDTKFRGRYDVRIHWGYTLERKRVDISVPKGVKITPGQPQVSTTK
jgi:hypothetical protein